MFKNSRKILARIKAWDYLCRKKENMETKKIDFIIKYFGCYTTIDGKKVLTSLANSSRVPAEEFWNVFTGDADKYFDIWKIENEKELSLTIDML